MIYRDEKLRGAPPDLVIGHLEHIDAALYALSLIEAKSYGVHHLDLVIGYLKHLDTGLYAS